MDDWLEKVQVHTYKVIAPLAIPETSPNYVASRKKLVGEEAMKIWVRSLTHRSYDPNQNKNYESLEFIGDPIMTENLGQIIIGIRPDIAEGELTDIKNSVLWKDEQARVSEQLGLGKLVRSYVPVNRSIREDLIEALVGALKFIGDEIFTVGTGSVLCNNFMVSVYGNINVAFDVLVHKDPKQQLKEIADKLHWFDKTEKKKDVTLFGKSERLIVNGRFTGSYLTILRLPPLGTRWMIANGREIKNGGVLAQVEASTSKQAQNDAVSKALVTLSRDYQLDWVEADRLSRVTPSDAVLQQMEADGVVDYDFQQYEYPDDNAIYVQLIGTKSNGRKITLMLVKYGALTVNKATVSGKILELYGERGSSEEGLIIPLEIQQ